MQFEYDPEQLIAEVEKRPALWNAKHPDYRVKLTKARLWEEIVKELVKVDNDGKAVTRTEIRELELQLQKKWKSLRDCFQKYLVNPKKTRRPYIYTKQLQFLLKDNNMLSKRKSTTPRSQPQTSESEDEESPPAKKWKRKFRLNISKDNDSDNVEEEDDFYYEEVGIKNEPVIVPESTQANQFMFASVDTQSQQSKSEYDDTDKMFLLSLLPHLKAIPEEFRLNVKVELMNVLKTAHENTSRLLGK